MKLKSVYALMLIFMFGNALFVLSCKKDMKNDEPVVINDSASTNAFHIPSASPITGSLSGLVVNESNTPQAGSEVKCGAATTTTDSRGIFHFNNIPLDKYISTVTVTNTGYFKAIRSFSANATRNYVSIKLIPKTLSGTVSSNPGGTVDLSNGTTLAFQANSIVDKTTGAPYTGDVKVYAAYIDPTASDISTRVPGSFMGRDANNLYSLQSTGMIAVDMESPSGQPLQLANNVPATIKMPIPASLTGSAPSSIDTWSLDDQGVWKKEGTATRSGDHYEMQVSHFSFWNCDIAANGIFLDIHVEDQEHNPLPNLNVRLLATGSNSWGSAYSYTDSAGNASGFVPAGVQFQLNLLTDPYNCATSLYSQQIGPFTSNTSLDITASLSASTELMVSGTATDCNNAALQNGTALIYADIYNYAIVPVVNGNYSAAIPHCTVINAITVTVSDNSNNQQATSGSIAVSGNAVTVPSISACGNTQSAVYTFGNGPGGCQLTSVSGDYLPGVALTANNTVSLAVNVISIGTYAISTSLENGISFSAFGIFTTLGQQSVILTGSGTPVAATTSGFVVQANGAPVCNFILNVGPQVGPSTWELLDDDDVYRILAQGNYISGVPANAGDSLLVWVNAITTGSYDINTGAPINGISFSATGTFTTTGWRTVILRASGTPVTEGYSRFTLQSGSTVLGTSFILNVFPAGTAANFVLGAVGNPCGGGTSVYGNYNVGQQIFPIYNTVDMVVNVSSVGTYSISTNLVNGFIFSGTGTFTNTGYQIIVLGGEGTPAIMGGPFIFRYQSNFNVGCNFGIQVN